MTKKDSIFGAEPDRLRQLIRSGMDVDEVEVEDHPPASGRVAKVMERPGTQIGYYKLLRVLGEGGMGVVYLAEQEQLIRRRVALKIIKPGMDSKRVLARFEAERQALALLDHPNIAQVHDAGTADSGRPYFVMEYVKGMPITEFCDRHSLTIEERLRLFQQICGALQHAHQKGIIHRDIKPSNILVASENDQANPKIIDFGVAKAIIQPLTDRTLVTEESQLLGTPEYMSPEQVEFANEDIDTRSDIYSLGVLLYELLTGVLPFDSDTLRDGGIENIRKVIRETDPKTPSTRLTKLGDEAEKVAENRRTEIAALAKCLHRELEWIPLKAMRKERSERYRSASELADDIENYLKGEPLMAGPLTSGYRLRKFLRRHKALVSGIAAVLVVSIIGTIVSVNFALGQANAFSKQAEALARNKAMSTFFINDILEPFAKESFRPTSTREIFDAAEKKLGTRFADFPSLEASMRWKFGDIYTHQFSDYGIAIANLERSIVLQQRELGNENAAMAKNWLGLAYMRAGEYRKAEALFREMLEIMVEKRKRQGRELGGAFYICVKSHLAHTYMRMGRYDEAERHLREIPFPPDPNEEWIDYKRLLPNLLRDRGRYDEAKHLYNDFLQRSRSVRNKENPIIMIELGILHTLQGNLDEAAPVLEKALEEGRKRWGEESWRTIDVKIALAVLRTKQGDYKNAQTLFNESLRNMQERLDDDLPDLLRAMSYLGVLYREQGRHDEAEKLLSEVHQRQAQSKELGPDHPHTLESVHELAVLHARQDHHQEAEKFFVKAAKGQLTKLGATHPHTQESIRKLIDLYETMGEQEKAEEWRAKLPTKETSEE